MKGKKALSKGMRKLQGLMLMNKLNKKIICFIAVFLLCFGMASAADLLTTKIEGEISGFSGISQLDNSDGTSLNVTIHNSSGGVVVSRNVAAGVYEENMTIVMTGAKFNLSYSTDYTYNLSTIYGDFTYNFTTPSHHALAALHTGQTASYTATGGEDADLDGTSKSYTNSSCGTGTVGDDHTGLCWQWDDNDTSMNWEGALTYCNDLNLGGHADWRLPNIVELRTMADYSCDDPPPAHCYSDYQNTAFKWRSTGDAYWSSTTCPDDTGDSFRESMFSGTIGNYAKTSTSYVRCVRSEGPLSMTKIENEISGFSGISQLDNSDGTSVNVTIHNSTRGVVVSRNVAAGIYKENMTIVMAGAKFNLSYGTDYIYNLSTIYGDFTYNFTTPSSLALGALHTGQTAGYTATGGEDADLDGTSKSYTNSSCGTGTVGDDYTGLCWQWDDYDTTRTWEQALVYCNDLDLGGHTDWRLPNFGELITMLDYSCLSNAPAHCYSDFQNTAFKWHGSSDKYWLSTTNPDSTGYAYILEMSSGIFGFFGLTKTSAQYVRCVRSD